MTRKTVERFRGRRLLQATQERALEKWNSDPKRPKWDRKGAMVQTVAGFPMGPLYYLDQQGEVLPRPPRDLSEKEAETWAKAWRDYWAFVQDPKRSLKSLTLDSDALEAEIADRLMRKFPHEAAEAWLAEADKFLDAVRDDWLRAVVDDLRRVLGMLGRVAPPPREGVRRDDVLAGVTRLLGRQPNSSELAWASVLCGARVDESGAKTAAQAIAQERRAMHRVITRTRRDTAT